MRCPSFSDRWLEYYQMIMEKPQFNANHPPHDMDILNIKCRRCGVTMEALEDSTLVLHCKPRPKDSHGYIVQQLEALKGERRLRAMGIDPAQTISGFKPTMMIVDDPCLDIRPRREQLLLLT